MNIVWNTSFGRGARGLSTMRAAPLVRPLWSLRLNKTITSCNRYFNIITELFARQCNAIAAQRVRRLSQVFLLYNNLYDKKAVGKLIERFKRQFMQKWKARNLSLLMSACLFNWNRQQVSEQEMESCGSEISSVVHTDTKVTLTCDWLDKWEQVIDRPNLQVWRKLMPNSHLYEYKVLGTFHDIPAKAFFNVQVDLEYRKKWDSLIIELDKVDQDENSGSEVIRWVTHFPYPMRSREYVYVRRYRIDQDAKTMVFVSHVVEHPDCPIQDKYVRVTAFASTMVVKSHSGVDENGFDYILTYHDDPQASIPSPALNWMASTGVPQFVDKLHNAAKTLHERHKNVEDQSEDDGDRVPM